MAVFNSFATAFNITAPSSGILIAFGNLVAPITIPFIASAQIVTVLGGHEISIGPTPANPGPIALPTITISAPVEGSVLSRNTSISFTVEAASVVQFMRRVVVSAILGGNVIEELVHEGIAFAAPYNGGSNARTAITNGYQFTILRLGGWRGTSVTLRIIAIDVFGNLAQKTLAVPQALYTWPVAVG
jgi:hypothetical protein